MKRRQMMSGVLAAALVAASALAFGGAFQVSPVRVQLSPDVPTAAITVRNESSTEEVVVQLRATDWVQQAGEDVYTPSQDLIATPPIFTMKPGGSQTVRVGLRKPVLKDVQQTFRLYITEVPSTPREGFQGLQVVLNIGIPVFIAPRAAAGALPAWRAKLAPDGKLQLSASNPANSHIQILDAAVYDEADGTAIAATQQPRYILANSTVTWQLATARAPKGRLRVTARTDAVPIDVVIPLE